MKLIIEETGAEVSTGARVTYAPAPGDTFTFITAEPPAQEGSEGVAVIQRMALGPDEYSGPIRVPPSSFGAKWQG